MVIDVASGRQLAPCLLLDASIYIFRYYFALPDRWHSREHGGPTAAVYGYTHFLLDTLARCRPTMMAAAFDESLGTGFRHQIFPGYKASRALPDEALAFQLSACQEVTGLLGIPGFSSHYYEADDLLGSLVGQLSDHPAPIAIVTRDKDLGQLLCRSQDFLWEPLADSRYHACAIRARFGVEPAQLADYLALVGDPVDDIPGIKGIGPKTAAVLLQFAGNLDNLYERLHELHALPVRGARGLAEKLRPVQEQVMLARQLTGIVVDLPVVESLGEIGVSAVCPLRLKDFCSRMGFAFPMRKIEALEYVQSGAEPVALRRIDLHKRR